MKNNTVCECGHHMSFHKREKGCVVCKCAPPEKKAEPVKVCKQCNHLKGKRSIDTSDLARLARQASYLSRKNGSVPQTTLDSIAYLKKNIAETKRLLEEHLRENH